MPYIKKEDRARFHEAISNLYPVNPGELNFIFTEIIFNYLETEGSSYRSFNDVIGALECCKLELYRRFIGPYEDKKIESNGDIRVK